ncbi:MAG TPA: 30S ribosomal protein S17e [Methanomicrobiales archaeon]|nr:30S ribosomal protein S17e [Methanomicrobiales archaeon]
MGTKPTYIKSVSEELLSKYNQKFSDNFDENKHTVEELTTIESKAVRNRVAGSITHQVNLRRKHK